MERSRFLVLGAGLSGLSAARALQAAGEVPVVLETAPNPGGLTRSIQIGAFTFDYTGHLLHLARSTSPSGVPFAGLDDRDWMQVHRRSFCLLEGELVPAPVQYHMGILPESIRGGCIESYRARPKLNGSGPHSFHDYLIGGFGEKLSEIFLIPQNEKTLAIPLTGLSEHAIRRFFPHPDELRVETGISNPASEVEEYNSRFWYPREGGIQRLVDGLRSGVETVRLRSEISRIDLATRTAEMSDGTVVAWEKVFSSIPLNRMCQIATDPGLRALGSEMSHSSTVCFNIGMRENLPASLAGVQWIYVPDRKIPFYRVGFYSNFTTGTCPPGYSSAYVEVGVAGGTARTLDIHGRMLTEVLSALETLGWVKRACIESISSTVIDCAYVHHTPRRDAVVGAALQRLRDAGIVMIGRYGTWDYISMEDSIYTAIDAVHEVLG